MSIGMLPPTQATPPAAPRGAGSVRPGDEDAFASALAAELGPRGKGPKAENPGRGGARTADVREGAAATETTKAGTPASGRPTTQKDAASDASDPASQAPNADDVVFPGTPPVELTAMLGATAATAAETTLAVAAPAVTAVAAPAAALAGTTAATAADATASGVGAAASVPVTSAVAASAPHATVPAVAGAVGGVNLAGTMAALSDEAAAPATEATVDISIKALPEAGADADGPVAAPSPGSTARPSADEAAAATAPVKPSVAATATSAAAPAQVEPASQAPATPTAPAAADAPVAAAPSTAATTPAVPQVLVTGTAATAPVQQAAPVAAAAPVPFTDQLVGPLARLREAPEGTHVLTVHVSPEDLGPVRVRAHITGEGVRIELLGATDASREALRVALTDLRRDLAATGLSADLQLAQDRGDSRQQSGLQTGGQGTGEGGSRQPDGARPASETRGGSGPASSSTSTVPNGAKRAGGIDLIA